MILQSWEERTDVGVSHLLQILSKGHSATSPTYQELPKMTDTMRLKKHIALLCDKLNKGAGDKLTADSKTQPKNPTSGTEDFVDYCKVQCVTPSHSPISIFVRSPTFSKD